ncbi:hypothetical protein CTEN210_12012 [Chaetoceros tenuissimus]|uniref:Uncharacterized protein n=1 Tax=Chaetoceros tenuissimus TaxID=426638 RepID=A0AAD3D2D5_9STRA|nr:hypothetical protein CTEN210_12012 [Chaetoceros tenuissimus]
MTANGEVYESGRKRARTEEEAYSSTSTSGSLAVFVRSNKKDRTPPKATASDILRANKISTRLSELLKEFPEMKFIFDFENLQAITETAVVKYAEAEDTKEKDAQLHMNYRQEALVSLYSLPDEVFSLCLSFVGKGHFGSVGLVSKKLNKAYKREFGQETAYLEMATSVNLSTYCLNSLCKSLEEKDEILKAAAVNGNLDILRHAVSNGYDLFPLVALQKTTRYEDDSDLYYSDDNEIQLPGEPCKVKHSKLVERGHLHVLKYLHEELNYFLGLQRYCYPAIEYGQLEILKWLDRINIMGTNTLTMCCGRMNSGGKYGKGYCESAIQSGQVKVLHWLEEIGYEIQNDYFDALCEAIRTKSIDMIQHCFDLGYDYLTTDCVRDAIKVTKSVEVVRKMHEMGMEFGEVKNWYSTYSMEDYFEIIKFLRSISVPWGDEIMKDILEFGTLEMIQFVHKDGCSWTGREYSRLLGLSYYYWSIDKFNYLVESGCTIDYEDSSSLICGLRNRNDLVVFGYFVGKNSSFDNELYKKMLECYRPWFEGMAYLLEKGIDVQNFKSIEEIFQKHHKIAGIKFFHSQGLPWCLDSSSNTILLSQIACYNDLDDVKWAYENGCKGGSLVPYVKEEWEEFGIRDYCKWKENRAFFAENGLLDEIFLEKSGMKKLDPKNVHEIGDAELGSFVQRESSFFQVDFCVLKNLVDHGYTFSSGSEKENVCKEAYKKCCEDSENEYGYRKRLALFVGMGAREVYQELEGHGSLVQH